jgi:hypothetical protein
LQRHHVITFASQDLGLVFETDISGQVVVKYVPHSPRFCVFCFSQFRGTNFFLLTEIAYMLMAEQAKKIR